MSEVAVIGMACIYPGAGDLEAFWHNVRAGHDAITEVPESRWEKRFYDPESTDVDRLYCRRAGFVDSFADFDAMRWGVMPVAAQSGEPDQLLALEVAARALQDAGYGDHDRDFSRETTGVILGRGGYFNCGIARLAQRVRTGPELIDNLRRLIPGIPEASLAAVREELAGKVGHHGPDTMIGLVPNLVASRIANRLDLHGPSYVIDAACASSLIAVDRACVDLETGRSDLVLAGGVHICHDITFWAVFCQLGALSRGQQIRPFDRRADGILMGEGVGVAVLKRRADAERDGDRIYAVIRGTGMSSDGRQTSLMMPGVRGQELALQRAWRAAELDPTTPGVVGMIEAHGTGTPAGDAAELETLARVFGPPSSDLPRAGLGSVKSMIGHAMPAAGMAGFIKAVLALHHQTLPPTLHCEEPLEELERTRFRIISAGEPWAHEGSVPRRAGVNAFGFGGINAHVVLEEHGATRATNGRGRVTVPQEAGERVLMLARATPGELLAALRAGSGSGGGDAASGGPCRLAVFEPNAKRLELAAKVVERGTPFRDRAGHVWFSPQGLLQQGGKVAFLFPGVDTDFRPQVDDVTRAFGRPPLPALQAEELERTGVGIILVNRLLAEVFGELGVQPDLVAGHSIGEWSAMIAAGVLPGAAVDGFLRDLEPGSLRVPGVTFAALGCGADRVTGVIEGLDDVHVSHDNCPRQSVLCGRDASVDEALARLRADGVLCQKLNFRSGFHSPLFETYLEPMQADIRSLPVGKAQLELWSATTCRPYPDEPDRIRALFAEHLVRPVRFRELLTAMHDAGARVFVQCGTGSLVGLVNDTLDDRAHLAVSANVPRRSGMAQLRRVAAALWVEGGNVEYGRLLNPIEPEPEAPSKSTHKPLRLQLGAPLLLVENAVELDGALPVAGLTPLSSGANGDPLLDRVNANLRAFAASQQDVVTALQGRGAAAPRPGSQPAAAPLESPAPAARNGKPSSTQHRFTKRISLETHPELLDHCFFRQPAGWSDPGEGYPVVPMTASLAMMIEIAEELAGGGLRVVRIEKVRAYSWIAVPEPLEIEVDARFDGHHTVAVRFEGSIEATLRLATAYPEAPAADFAPRTNERPTPMTAAELYEKRWMFHGPAYRGVTELVGMGDDGIRGRLVDLPTQGALLDCAGQLMGLWISITSERDKMAMPVMVGAIDFHGPPPTPGTEFDCAVQILRDGAKQVRADMELSRDGRAWVRITGWEDRRFESDARTWAVKRDPEHNVLAWAVEGAPGVYRLPRVLETKSMLDYMARRYLNKPEIEQYIALKGERQVQWLFGRMVVKDAVRSWLWERGAPPIFPIEIEIVTEAAGRPRVVCEHAEDLTVSIAHKGDIAVAQVAAGREAGVDIEHIEPRGAGFVDISFTEVERALLPEVDRDEWITRFWVAKEAVAKARGTGFGGNPRRYAVSAVDGARLRVDGMWVATQRDGDNIIGWTEAE